MPVNGHLLRYRKLQAIQRSGFALAATLLLVGCSSSFTVHPESKRDRGRLTSRQPNIDPDFSSQLKPMQAPSRAGAAPVRTATGSLVSLYGELQDGWQESQAAQPWDGSSNVSQITFATEGACSDPDMRADSGALVFASTQHSTTSDIYLTNVPGRALTQLTTDPADDIMPAFDATGSRIAFASNRAGNWDIYIMSINGGQPIKVTDEPEHELHPSWSPDGRSLIYCKLGSRSHRWEMWVVDTENPGVRRFLDYGLFPQWCPDVAQSKILFQRARQRGSRFFSIWTVDYINGDAVHPTEIITAGNAAVINPAWSPDGSRIVFVTIVQPDESSEDSSEQSDVWLVNLNGAGRTNLTNGRYANYQPVWGAGGQVFFVSNRTGVDNIWSVSANRALAGVDMRSSRISTVTPINDFDSPGGRP